MRRTVFISYYHGDQEAVNKFIRDFSDVFIPKAVGIKDGDFVFNSDNPQYIMRRIREEKLQDSTVTIVLIGRCTHSRRYVDWEIKASLQQGQTLREIYPECLVLQDGSLSDALSRVKNQTGQKFVIIIDEWDVLIRDEAQNQAVLENYINFLRGLFKGTEPTKYIALAYLTGILPIKKMKTQSALNNFDEFTMLSAGNMASYVGFTESEVKMLAKKYHQNYEKVKRWYDGYRLNEHQIYNPRAVVGVMLNGEFKSYWSETASYETIVPLINMDFDGLKSAVIEMLSGAEVKVNTATFKNDTVNIQNRDEVLTYIIHLGYLGYDQNRRSAFVPNEEIRQELTLAVREIVV